MQSTYLEPQNRVDRIDGLRALAVSGVLFLHAQMLMPTPWLAPLAHYGQLGVQMFFFLSGYIIYMAWDRAGSGTGGFYWNRLARIAPLYYLMLVLTYIFGWSMSPEELNTENFVWHLFFAQGFSGGYAYAGISPMWSLTSEVAFYLVFPWLQRCSTRTLLILFAGAFVFGDVDTGLAYWLTGSTALSATPLGAAKFMLGGMIVYRHRELFAERWMIALSGILAALMALAMAGTMLELDFPAELPKSTILLFACPFLMFSRLPLFRVALENRIAQHLGIVSYSIYLWQLPIIQELQKLGWEVNLPVLAAIVVAVGTISYFAVERPFLTWFRSGQTQPSVAKARQPVRKPLGPLDAARTGK